MSYFAKKELRTLFWYDKNAADASEGVVCCSVLLKGRENYFTTKIAVKKADWGGNKGRFLSSHKTYHRDNAQLSTIEAKLNEIYDGLVILKGYEFIEAKMVVEAYRFFERPENTRLRPDKEGLRLALESRYSVAPTVLELVEAHRKYKARFVDKGTLTTYNTRIKNLKAFLKSAGKVHLSAEEFRPSWCVRFCDWMYNQKMQVNHVARHILFYREALDAAVEREDISVNPMGKFTVKREDVKDLRHLKPYEVELLESIDFDQYAQTPDYARKLSTVRDIFLFLTYTSFHISDYLGLTEEHLQIRASGLWLIKSRNKTGKNAYVKLNQKAALLLKKYGGVRGLPRMSKDDVNSHLKVIEQIAGFKIGLSTKIGRKTCANNLLNYEGVDKDSVAAFMGLNSTKHIGDYAQITVERLERKLAW